jgi:cytochrome o ubiquinol oxidase subunit 1
MLWFFAFLLNFSVAGMTGILLSAPPVDYQVHNSLFLIAHFHGMVIGGFLFGFFAAFTYWFPKFTGFFLDERLNRYAFWCWLGGFLLAFMPLYMLGFMGATRRLDHYEYETGWHGLFIIVSIGALIIMCGAAIQVYGLYSSIRDRKKFADPSGGDPWNGRTLEWSITSPPPIYNFAVVPTVSQIDPLWAIKRGEAPEPREHYEDIHMPRNTPIGFYIGMLAIVFGFAFTWHIFWLVILSFAAILACVITRLSEREEFDIIPNNEVKKIEEEARARRPQPYVARFSHPS